MQSISDNIKFASYNDAKEVVDKLFQSIHLRYQGNLETLMEGSEFVFDSVQLVYYKCHRVNFRCSSSYIDSPDWIKKRKSNSKAEK